jgi:membrane protein
VRRRLARHDLPILAAGVTFYAALASLPALSFALWAAGLLVGVDTVRELGAAVAEALPADVGTDDGVRQVVDTATSLGPASALVAVLPATLYGEGLVRAFDRLSERERRRTGLRGRLLMLAAVAFTPALVLLGLAATSGLTRSFGQGAARLLGVYLAFVVTWLVVSVALTAAYRGLALDSPRWGPLLWGAFGTGSFVAGTALGYLLFLAIGLDLGDLFAGRGGLANAVVALSWLWVLHGMVLVGHVVVLALDRRLEG